MLTTKYVTIRLVGLHYHTVSVFTQYVQLAKYTIPTGNYDLILQVIFEKKTVQPN